MTMVKREVNSIWSRVREDLDVDDLIFDYDTYHTPPGGRAGQRAVSQGGKSEQFRPLLTGRRGRSQRSAAALFCRGWAPVGGEGAVPRRERARLPNKKPRFYHSGG